MELCRQITQKEIDTYRQDGVVCLRKLFSSEWVEHLKIAAQECMENPGELHVELAAEQNDSGRFFHDTFMWRYNERCKQFIYQSPSALIAKILMNSQKTTLFYDQWLIKEPQTQTRTPWHHDLTYWPIDGDQICTIWLALDSVSAENGSVEYIKGSHKWGKKYRAVSFSGNSQYTEPIPEFPDIEAMRSNYDILQFDLEPGDCTAHHGLSIHSSPGNKTTGDRRRAHVTRWTGDDIVFHPRDGLQELPILPDLKPGDPLDSELWPRVI